MRASHVIVPAQTISKHLRRLRSSTLRTKILVFAILVTVIPSGLTAWLSYSQNRRGLEEKISQELLSASIQTSREIDVWLRERVYDLRVFASSYEVSEQLAHGTSRSPTRGRLNNYLKSVRERFSDYEELLVLDPQGRTVATTAAELRPLRLAPDWTKQLGANEPVIGEAYWDRSLGKGILLVAVPVQRADGQVLGALAARLNLRGAQDGLRAFAPSTSGETYLIGPKGVVIATSRANSSVVMRTTLKPKLYSRLVTREGRVVTYESLTGQQVVGSLKQVPRVKWAVLAEVPARIAYQQVRRFRNLTLLLVLGLLCGVSMIAYRFATLIVRPLERLIRGAAEVAEGDLAVDLPAADGEVGELTAVFNHMVGRLRQGREELDAMNERLRKQNEDLELLSTSDALTGLPNRRCLTQRLSEELSRAYREKCSFTVLMADVDEFKKYNDAFGHPAGDEVLKKVASILVASTRTVDCAARYGGEEFAVLLTDTSGEAALAMAERIRTRVASEDFPGRKITLSMGIAEYPGHGYTADALISHADEALYEAKRSGRNRIVCARAKPTKTKQKS